MKILTIVGARPQVIKAEPLTRAIRDAGHESFLLHTGQHWDFGMSEIFFEQMGIAKANVNLGVGSGRHGQQTARMLEGIESVLLKECPDWVVVLGDTNSTLAGALAAAKLHYPLAHVEAGLRSFNRRMPEEVNRVLTDHISDALFAPTEVAVNNLIQEGITSDRVILVGDVMYDAFLHFSAMYRDNSRLLESLGLGTNKYILATVHRAENTDDTERLRAIFEGLQSVGESHSVIMPLHPRTRAALAMAGLQLENYDRIQAIDPLGYLDMLGLERSATLIASDSGGVQKEAYFAGVPCVTLRNETEWTELIQTGWNRLCPPTSGAVIAQTIRDTIGSRGRNVVLYGGGQAAQRIVANLRKTS